MGTGDEAGRGLHSTPCLHVSIKSTRLVEDAQRALVQ